MSGLSAKIGPLPTWAWLAVGGAAVFVLVRLRQPAAGTQPAAQQSALPSTAADWSPANYPMPPGQLEVYILPSATAAVGAPAVASTAPPTTASGGGATGTGPHLKGVTRFSTTSTTTGKGVRSWLPLPTR